MEVDQERDFVGQLGGVATTHITGQEFPEFGYESLRDRAALRPAATSPTFARFGKIA